jgi:peroxin-10
MVDAIPVHITQGPNGPEPQVLTDARRLTLVGLHAFLPYVYERYLLHRPLGPSSGSARERPRPRPFGWLLNPLVAALRALTAPGFLQWLRRLHTLLFYFRGHFATVAMRVGGVRLVRPPQAHQATTRYSVLGALLAAELLGSTVVRALQKWRAMRAQAAGGAGGAGAGAGAAAGEAGAAEHMEEMPEGRRGARDDLPEEAARGGRRRCVLCQGPMHQIAATECGHLFCWDCIMGWGVSSPRAECPLCRQAINPSKLLLLPWHGA